MNCAQSVFRLFVSLIVLGLVAGCGDNRSDPFSKCGNGICDSAEECDDGAVSEGQPDEDQCLSTCQYNRCGDGFINSGGPTTGRRCELPVPADVLDFEECDPGSFQPVMCSTFGFSGGEATCTDDCKADTSKCGPAFTPTATSTSTPSNTPTITPGGATFTPTPTPTATPTATSTRSAGCGNGVIDEGESCDDGGVCMGDNQDVHCITMGTNEQCPAGLNMGNACSANEECPESFCPMSCGEGVCVTRENDECPANCIIEPCEPTENTRDFSVRFELPFGEMANSVTFFVNYPEGQVSMPGVGLNPQTIDRVFTGTCDSEEQEPCRSNTQCPGSTCNSLDATVLASDFDHALRIVVPGSSPIAPGPVLVLRFDDCSGAEPPSGASFSCIVEGCAGAFGTIDGCECTIEER